MTCLLKIEKLRLDGQRRFSCTVRTDLNGRILFASPDTATVARAKEDAEAVFGAIRWTNSEAIVRLSTHSHEPHAN